MGEIINIIINSITSILAIYILTINMVLQRMKGTGKAVLLLFLALTEFLFEWLEPAQLGTIPMLIGVSAIVALYCRQKLLNIICVLFGYISAGTLGSGFQWGFNVWLQNGGEADGGFFVVLNLLYLVIVYGLTKGMHHVLKYRFQIERLNKTGHVSWILLIQMSGCTAIYILNVLAGEVLGRESKLILYNIVLLLIYLVITYIVFWLLLETLNRMSRMQKLIEYYGQSEQYERENISKLEELRQFRHNYLNIFRGMEGYVKTKDWEGLEAYYGRIVEPIRREVEQIDFRIVQLERIKVPGLKSLLSVKIREAMEQNIEVILGISEEISDLDIEPYALLSIMGVFLDNAVEAAQDAEFREILISAARKEDRWHILIRNTFRPVELDMRRIGEAGYSTKGKNRGIGLYSVKRILKKYRNVVHTTSVEAPYFIQRLEIGRRAGG